MMPPKRTTLSGLAVALVALALLAPPASATATTSLVSVREGGGPGDDDSEFAVVSSDGKWVAFQSAATDLVANDTNGVADIFLRNMSTGKTRRVSVTSGGQQADDGSETPVISSDGRFVAFSSLAHLVADDAGFNWDVYVYDRVAGTIERVSVTSSGAEASGSSYRPSISADGRLVAFDSTAEDLVGTDSNLAYDVFVHDRQTGSTVRVSRRTDGGQALGGDSVQPSISPDGRWVAYQSSATNLVAGDAGVDSDVFLFDRREKTVVRVSDLPRAAEPNDGSYGPTVSNGGRFVAFIADASNLVPKDTNADRDVFAWTRNTRAFERMDVSNTGKQSGGAPSSFTAPSISANGRYVAFDCGFPLVPKDGDGSRDVYVRDRSLDKTKLVSLTRAGHNSADGADTASISSTGAWVVFASDGIYAGTDALGFYDIFERGPLF